MLSNPFFRGRRLSCGIVILAPTRELLLCHVTGQRHWDLPKGGIHDGETPAEAAVRETMEETGLIFALEALVDLGPFAYTGKKDLHLFAAPSERVDPLSLCCESTFVERGSSRRLPEMDGFGWFSHRSPARAVHVAHGGGADAGAGPRPGGRRPAAAAAGAPRRLKTAGGA